MPGDRFHVRLLPEEGFVGGGGERVIAEIGLEGFNILDAGGGRTLRKYPLHHISRWSLRGTSLILFTRSPSDVEDRSVTLEGDETTIRSVLDTLTCSCMQMAEMLQSGRGPTGTGQMAANSLHALLRKSKKPALLTADQVEFWHDPEKAGWMHSQGEHIRTWRKRWFVLKQGFLFRFSSSDVAAASKPRGIVDLSTVTDVVDGSAATGRPNSVQLSTATGSICYLCESETSQVEWYSALEGAVAKIVKLVAGVDEGEEDRRASTTSTKSWTEQLVQTYSAAGSATDADMTRGGNAGGSKATGGERGQPQMVSVVNYETPGSVGVGGYRSRTGAHSSGPGGPNYVTVDYGSIAGATTVQDGEPAPGDKAAAAEPYGPYSTIVGYTSHVQAQGRMQYAAYPFAVSQPTPENAVQHQPLAGGSGGGGNLMDAVTAPQAHQQQAALGGSPWKVHYTAEGRPYFYNVATGVTQWNAPA